MIVVVAISLLLFSSCDGTDIPDETSGVEIDKLPSPTNLRIDEGEICWDYVEDAKGYKLSINDTEAQTRDLYYDLPDGAGVFYIKVKAISDSEEYADSDWSAPIKHIESTAALKFTLLEDGSGYEVTRLYESPNVGLEGVVVIPDTYQGLPVTRIADHAFQKYSPYIPNTVTTEFILPSGLKSIGYQAFDRCTALKRIVIPEGMTELGLSFTNCTSLEYVELPESLISIISTFQGCKNLKSIKLPSNLVTLGGFQDTGLTEIEIPSSVKVIESCAFQRTELSEIVIPSNVTRIEASAFEGCKSLAKISLPSDIEYLESFAFKDTAWYNAQGDVAFIHDILIKYDTDETKLIDFPAGIKRIAGGVFYGNDKLQSVEFIDGVDFIGGAVFAYSSVKSVVLPSDLKAIPYGMFMGCDQLESVSIPDGVTEIGERAFYNCVNLVEVSLPSALKTIGSQAFAGCNKIEYIKLPEGLLNLGFRAFFSCDALKTVDGTGGLKTFYEGEFSMCYAIEYIKFSQGFEWITTNGFGSKALRKIVVPTSVYKIESAGLIKEISNEVYNIPDAIYYEGDEAGWSKIDKLHTVPYSNEDLTERFNSIPVYFYSEAKPTGEGRYWHYVDGVPTVWGE